MDVVDNKGRHVMKKLIEVALPLDAINAASAREKSIRHGHPSTLHLWWARRPLAAARAVIWAQMVDDPSAYVDVLLGDPATRRKAERELRRRRKPAVAGNAGSERGPRARPRADRPVGAAADGEPQLADVAAELERERLFGILRELVKWENSTNEELLERARAEIRQSWRRTCEAKAGHPRAAGLFDRHRLPAFHDPFAGGGALPLEAQRLGLEAHASDLNPVAVLINKAMIEIPPRFAGRPPVNPEYDSAWPTGTGEADRLAVSGAQSASHRSGVASGAAAGRSGSGRRGSGQARLGGEQWRGARGLAEDVRHYGRWMREEAKRRIGHLYPPVEVTPQMVRSRPDLARYAGRKLTVIAWLWARTVRSPNPAFADVEVPLCSTFMLSTKKGKEAWVEPVVEGRGYRFEVRVGAPPDLAAAKRGTKLARGANFRCLVSGSVINDPYIKGESMSGRMGSKLTAIVVKGKSGRVYLPPTPEQEDLARSARPAWQPDETMNRETSNLVSGRGYGFFTWSDLFTPRQLMALTTFSDLVGEAMDLVRRDAGARFAARRRAGHGRRASGNHAATGSAGAASSRVNAVADDRKPGEASGDLLEQWPVPAAESSRPEAGGSAVAREEAPVGGVSSPLAAADDRPLRDGGAGALAYAEAVAMYLAFVVDKVADYWSSICTWNVGRTNFRSTFARQAIPMTWDYAEANPLSSSTGNWMAMVGWIGKVVRVAPASGGDSAPGFVKLADAGGPSAGSRKVVSTDPPYYDNIGYADLSDFFYVWLRRSMRPVFPDLFGTMAVPKAEELVATPYRHGGKQEAEEFFLEGMTRALNRLAEQAHPAVPVTIYYAFKQSERNGGTGIVRTGWETFLEAVMRSGFAITGTWPMRTERRNRMIGMGTNALASSIVLVCRPRPADAALATRREFLQALRTELPLAIQLMQSGAVAPVDLAQAAIGPGMAVYTRHAKVLDAEGKALPVREALALINQVLGEVLAEQEGEFDSDSRWALTWFEQSGFEEGDYGVAETLSKAKNTSVEGMVLAGIIRSRAGKVRLLRPAELNEGWDPVKDSRLTAWETVHHLVRVLESGGEQGAAELVGKLGGTAETARELCYRLYTICEQRKRAPEALSYNTLVQSWPEIKRLSRTSAPPEQTDLL